METGKMILGSYQKPPAAAVCFMECEPGFGEHTGGETRVLCLKGRGRQVVEFGLWNRWVAIEVSCLLYVQAVEEGGR